MRRNNFRDEVPERAARFLAANPSPEFPPTVREALTDHPWNGYGLYLWGPPGGGKTVAAYHLAKAKGYRFITEATIIARWRETMRPEVYECTEEGLLDWLRYYAKRLVIDDIGGGDAATLTDYSRGVVNRVIDHLYQAGGTPVLTGNRDLAGLAAALGDRCASRIAEMCRVVKYDHADRRLEPRLAGNLGGGR